MIVLTGKTKTAEVEAEAGLSLLDLAMKHEVDWSFSCTRGTCARCRCLVTEGMAFLEEVTDAEWDRLEPEELDEGYRLGCQAIVREGAGRIVAANKTYF
ncbi:(2Fe-2S)-binding protein [Paenibacillus sp. J5C_2022]|uniref:2Fe-2S iron-sulfur cluster-binding protein n=1 Tax=Paenibacillus sp. J5C2022 TaxID=2977129 RepID=UPI0021CF7573|nr:(2Fe-2S)-binding protein [Paenibacillus sp. J5C2022]MCU6710023.1 (2Fe-2S)-binding protein [Paenibacillus sp. J5C2022]